MQNPDLPPLPASLDSSMLNAYRSCKKKFYYNYLLNLHPAGRSVHLVAGAAFADAIDASRKYAYAAGADYSYEKMIEAAMSAFIRQWGDYNAPDGHGKSFVNTFKAVELYLQNHPPLTDNIKPLIGSDGAPTTEFSFAIPLPIQHPSGDPFIYCGRFDMLGKWDGELLTILDEKTTSALGPSWLNQWDMRGQFLGYCWACQQLGYPVRQVAIRGVGLLKTEIKFLTALQQYPQYLIDRWYAETLDTIAELRYNWEHRRFGYNFGDACGSYGGCSYKDLCVASEPERWMANYEVRIWNPILREEKQPLE